MKVILILCVLVVTSYGRKGFGPGEQDWEYVTVRPQAHMFWWLYETTSDVSNVTNRPLVIWLQGGPGGSSTGFGNFEELGPLDVDLNKREHTWVKDVNVLFIDNPVGTGFSYVENQSTLTTTNNQIARDLIALLEGFYDKRPEYHKVPLYIASESYGGKMAIEFALELDKKIKTALITSNLKGVSLIDSWISPIDSVMNWGPFLYYLGAVDKEGFAEITKSAQRTKTAVDAGQFKLARLEWGRTESVISTVTKGVDFYNILTKIPTQSTRIGKTLVKPGIQTHISQDDKLTHLMNRSVREALNLNVSWSPQNDDVFNSLAEDFMKPVTHIVEQLLNETSIKVQVITGQLDLIVETAGTIQWVDNLQWTGTDQWKKVPRNVLSVNGINEGYQKVLDKLSVFWVNRAGHMVPADNPIAMGAILKKLVSN